jgi:hypothetical protein
MAAEIEDGAVRFPYPEDRCIASIAISLKRIADSLGKITNADSETVGNYLKAIIDIADGGDGE